MQKHCMFQYEHKWVNLPRLATCQNTKNESSIDNQYGGAFRKTPLFTTITIVRSQKMFWRRRDFRYYRNVCAHAHTRTHTRIDTYAYTHADTQTHITRTDTDTRIYTHIHRKTHTHIRLHTEAHTHNADPSKHNDTFAQAHTDKRTHITRQAYYRYKQEG